MWKRGKGGIKLLKSCWRIQRFGYSYHMFLLKTIWIKFDFLSHTHVAWVRGEMEKAENSYYKVLVWFIHTVFTLSRVWQNQIPVHLRATWLRWNRNHKVSSNGEGGHQQKKYSVRAEWLRHSGRASSEPSETPRLRITPRPASIQRVALNIALRSLVHCLFAFCWSPILNDHSGVVANCDNTSEWVHWVRACIGIAMRWVTLPISLLAFLLPARKMQLSLY
jgi:hypothetical protein